jgi:hypothetical protein
MLIVGPHPSSSDNPLLEAVGRKLNRWQVRSCEDAAVFLAKKARNAAKSSRNPRILLLGGASELNRWISEDLVSRKMAADCMRWDDLSAGAPLPREGYAAVICTDTDIRGTAKAARAVLSRPELTDTPFEAVTLTESDYAVLNTYDRLKAADLVSPLPLETPGFSDIYEDSLLLFEQKCDVRDYMDLCQAVHMVAAGGIAGDVAEFGSFRGHSGYLIARLLGDLGLPKRLFLFDTFESFPPEPLGIDGFWSRSHPVDFAGVRDRFAPFPHVTLVKGDFTRTFESAGIERLAMVHVDCDSFRGTDYLIRRLFPEVLSRGGVMVFEDYGHPQLLGSRVAIHGYFEERRDATCFFSHFSGCFLAIKR